MNIRSSSSSSSLTIDDIPPTPPSRTPKRVSFSDELPTVAKTSPTSSTDNLESFNPISDVLKQTSAYMENLHKIYNDNINEKTSQDSIELHQDIKITPPDDDMTALPPQKILKVKQDSSVATICPTSVVEPSVPSSSGSISSCTNNSQLVEIELNEKMLVRNGLSNYLDRYNLKPADKNCSLMEKENRRDKIRWLLISECSAMFGDNKHTREGFRRIVLNEVCV